MEVVAHHLQMEAKHRDIPEERDLFGRSAYNRYYYAVFLCVREMFLDMNTTWLNAKHASFPELLRGTIEAELKRGKLSAYRSHDDELKNLCIQAIHAARELAKIMESAKASREVADYQPDVKIEFINGGRFKLKNVEITDAHQWPIRARAFTKTISSAWKQLND